MVVLCYSENLREVLQLDVDNVISLPVGSDSKVSSTNKTVGDTVFYVYDTLIAATENVVIIRILMDHKIMHNTYTFIIIRAERADSLTSAMFINLCKSITFKMQSTRSNRYHVKFRYPKIHTVIKLILVSGP